MNAISCPTSPSTSAATSHETVCGRRNETARAFNRARGSESFLGGGTKFRLDQALGGIPASEAAEPETGGMAVSNRGGGLQLGAHDTLVEVTRLRPRPQTSDSPAARATLPTGSNSSTAGSRFFQHSVKPPSVGQIYRSAAGAAPPKGMKLSAAYRLGTKPEWLREETARAEATDLDFLPLSYHD